MTDINPKTCTAVTLYFEGEGHRRAADNFVIQFADGGLDGAIEEALSTQGVQVADTDFSVEKRSITIRLEG